MSGSKEVKHPVSPAIKTNARGNNLIHFNILENLIVFIDDANIRFIFRKSMCKKRKE